MYSYGSPHIAAQKQDDQLERTFSSFVRIQAVVLKTYLGRWTIGRSGERGSGISVPPARYDDDDERIMMIRVGENTIPHPPQHLQIANWIGNCFLQGKKTKLFKFVYSSRHDIHCLFFLHQWVHNQTLRKKEKKKKRQISINFFLSENSNTFLRKWLSMPVNSIKRNLYVSF